ncbi:lipoyl synthase [Fusibacter sp. JL216-2]|uniref:lipoyl synthase n=1 Tax=Fusibacter sp. JL216-2 TaxID=3071453 RepID=UPI003D3470B7
MTERKPEWLKVRLHNTKELNYVKKTLQSLSLHTVCEEANCPNRVECYSNRTATFMILGNTCTRHCKFCNVTDGCPSPLDPDEPQRVAQAVKALNLKYAVVTSVTRDDLEDGGASHFKAVIESIKAASPDTKIEVLIPDFKGNLDALKLVIDAQPDVINHNIETVPRLYDNIRPEADYLQSLQLINNVKSSGTAILTKSGIMLGLGEKEEEVKTVIEDLYANGCDILTVGQYLPPSKDHAPLTEYITPEKFKDYEVFAKTLGYHGVASGPRVRSSYKADHIFDGQDG